MDGRLRDKVAIVTGGARGIGAAFCEGLAQAGATVVVADVLDGSAVAERIAERQAPSIYIRADVTSKDLVESLVPIRCASSAPWTFSSTMRRCSPICGSSLSRTSKKRNGTG